MVQVSDDAQNRIDALKTISLNLGPLRVGCKNYNDPDAYQNFIKSYENLVNIIKKYTYDDATYQFHNDVDEYIKNKFSFYEVPSEDDS